MPDPEITYWAQRPEWLGIWGALGGAVVGGVISAIVSWMVAVRATRDQLALRADDRKEVEKALAFRLFVKAGLIASDYVSTFKAIDVQIADNGGADNAEFLFTLVIPVVGKLAPQQLDVDEISVFYRAGESSIVNDAIELFMRHEAFISSFEEYKRQRIDLKNYMPMTSVDGNIVSSALSEQQRLQLMPRFLELESLIQGIYRFRDDDIKASASLCNRLGPAARKYFGDEKFPIANVAEVLAKPTPRPPAAA
jgi:hypothetical protein